MAEEEVMAEVVAVQAVYEDDCQVIQVYPPHLLVHLKPRTADVSSQQFVEATISIVTGLKYPEEQPDIRVIDSKGLDEQRLKHLTTSICNKASELSSSLMLVALCEEAVEQLSRMNHPDGDCPLCLESLLDEGAGSIATPFMKLMSCFHCFHCHCIIKWWNWIQTRSMDEITASTSSAPVQNAHEQQGVQKEVRTSNCPVCRKVFLAKDIEHILDLVGINSHTDSKGDEIDEGILLSDYEKSRRQRYEAILKLQQENNGLIEPKRTEVLLPGMFLPQPVTVQPNNESECSESHKKDSAANSSSRPEGSRGGRGSRKHSYRNFRAQNSRKQVRKGSAPI